MACHNQDDATASLALDSFDAMIAGGASGEVLAAGNLDSSRLWKLVTHQEEPKMPPGDKLSDAQLQVLRKWIEGGLLKDDGSKPLKSSKPTIVKLEVSNLGKPIGEPAMPEQLFHEPVLWASHPGPVDALAISPWAPLVAVAWQRQVSFYDTKTYQLLGIIPYMNGVPQVVRFSRDGSLVLVAGGRHAATGSAALFDVKSGARLATIGDELDIVLAADISPDLSLVAIGGPKKIVRVYRVADGSLAYQIKKHTDWVTVVGFSPDGRLLATADRNGDALLWQADAGYERADLRGHKEAITALDWRSDAAMLATASEDGTVKLWSPAGQLIKSVSAHKPGVLSIQFARDGNWVTTGRDRKVKTWQSDGGAIADLGKLGGIGLKAAFSYDGKKVIASDYAGEVRIIDVASKKCVQMLSANPRSIADRLVAAKAAQQQAEQKVQKLNRRVKKQEATLEQSKIAHATHEKKLSDAQAKLLAEKQQYDELTELLAAQRKTLETTTPTDESADEIESLERELQTTSTKQKEAEKNLHAAEAIVAQVEGETAGLPNLADLSKQHEQAKEKAEQAKKQLEKSSNRTSHLEVQRDRFLQASQQFADNLQKQQAQQQELAKQSGRLEVEHQQAADNLATHRAQLTDVAQKLKALQEQLDKIKIAEVEFLKQEQQQAADLEKVRAALAESEQKIKLLKSSKHDFDKAETLRQTYNNNKAVQQK